jgi:hypothetical protein
MSDVFEISRSYLSPSKPRLSSMEVSLEAHRDEVSEPRLSSFELVSSSASGLNMPPRMGGVKFVQGPSIRPIRYLSIVRRVFWEW